MMIDIRTNASNVRRPEPFGRVLGIDDVDRERAYYYSSSITCFVSALHSKKRF